MNNHFHAAIEAQLGAYTTGGLEPWSRVCVAEHLEQCAACRQLVREYATVLQLVPLALPEAVPPLGAKGRLLARARSRRDLRLSAMYRRRWAFLARAPRLLAAALVLVFALLGGLALQQGAGPERIVLTGSLAAPSARGGLILTRSAGRAELTVAGLPALPPDRSYQLWFVQPDNTRQSGGVFTVDADGRATVSVHIPDAREAFVRVGVTEEPRGGSPAPTSESLLAAEL